MQHDHVLKKLNLYLLTQTTGPGRGLLEKIFATMLLHLVIPFKLIFSMTMLWKRWILTFWPQQRGQEGVCWQHIGYHAAAFGNSLLLLYATWPCSEKVKFWTNNLIPSVREASVGKKFATMLLHLVIHFNLIRKMTMFWKIWPIDPIPRYGVGAGGGGAAGKVFTSMLLHLWCSLIWYATWPCSGKAEVWPAGPFHRVEEGGLRAKNCYHVAAFVKYF